MSDSFISSSLVFLQYLPQFYVLHLHINVHGHPFAPWQDLIFLCSFHLKSSEYIIKNDQQQGNKCMEYRSDVITNVSSRKKIWTSNRSKQFSKTVNHACSINSLYHGPQMHANTTHPIMPWIRILIESMGIRRWKGDLFSSKATVPESRFLCWIQCPYFLLRILPLLSS